MEDTRNQAITLSSMPGQPRTDTREPSDAKRSGRRIEGMSPHGVGTSIRRFVGDLLGDIDRAFDGAGMGAAQVASPRYGERAVTRKRWTPRLDVVARAGQLLVHVDLPGMRLDGPSTG
jgi:hypothetical protein